MGISIIVHCRQCEYNAGDFTLGIGRRHTPEAVFYGGVYGFDRKKKKPMLASLVKSWKIKKEAFDLITAGSIPDKQYGHEVYGCNHCKSLHGKFYFRIMAGEKIFEPEYKCPKCKKPLSCLNVPDRDCFQWPCLSCGNKELAVHVRLCWD